MSGLQPLVHEVEPREPREGSRFRDISGLSTEAFDVIKLVGFASVYSVYLCRCRCGNEFVRRANHILQRPASTCGKCTLLKYRYRHLYTVWRRHREDMVDSLANNFAWFVELFEGRGSWNRLCKRDQNKPHSETNSVWLRQGHRTLKFKGRLTTLQELSDELGLTRERVRQRIRDCGGVDKAMSSPAGLSLEDNDMSMASTKLDAETSKRVRALAFILDDSVSNIIKRLLAKELDKYKADIDAMIDSANKTQLRIKKA